MALLNGLRTDAPQAALATLLAQSPTGVDLARFALSWNLSHAEAEQLWEQAGLHVFGEGEDATGLTQPAWEALRATLIDVLQKEHEASPDMIGVEPERLRRMLSITLSRPVFDALLAQSLESEVIAQTRSWLHLPEHRASIMAEDREQFAALKPLLDAQPYNPPRVRDVAHASGELEPEVRRLFKRLARAGELYPVAHDHYFTAEAVSELANVVHELTATQGSARAASFRDRLYPDGGGGRKVAIRILEFFDRVGYTRRLGDDHVLRDTNAQQTWFAP